METDNKIYLDKFYYDQIASWDEARERYESLENVETRSVDLSGFSVTLQHNPARITSAKADVSAKGLSQRPCFLCEQNRPSCQNKLQFEEKFQILLNPFPILPYHYTIPLTQHKPQRIRKNFSVIYRLLCEYDNLTVFYNGAESGASAPDHLHLQAVKEHKLPIQQQWDYLVSCAEKLFPEDTGNNIGMMNEGIYYLPNYPATAILILSRSETTNKQLFERLYDSLLLIGYNTIKGDDSEPEPMLNIVSWIENNTNCTIIFPRKKHRPDCFFATGESQLLVSPGALDMAGLLILPRNEDYKRLDAATIQSIYDEVACEKKLISKIKDYFQSN